MMIYTPLGIVPLMLTFAAFAIPLLTLIIKKEWFYHLYALVFSIIALCYTAENFWLVVYGVKQPVSYLFGGWIAPLGIVYTVDGLGAVLGLLVGIDMVLIVLYSIWYMRGEEGIEWYYTLLLLLESAMIGIVYTGDIFNLFVMIELLAISAYGLVGFYRHKKEAIEAAIKYALIGATATTMFFLSIVYIYGTYGTVNMADLALKARLPWITRYIPQAAAYFAHLSGTGYGNPIVATAIAIALALWAFTFKAAVFPNYFWLPDAHPEAPTPVSAALSGLVVKMGAYATIRLLYTIFGVGSLIDASAAGGWSLRDVILFIILLLGAVSAMIGSLVMIIQNDIKRILAYSTIDHLGIIFMGIGVAMHSVSQAVVAIALTGVVLHMINHSFGKTMLFMASGIYIKNSGTRDITRMRGIGRLLPVTSLVMIIGLLHLLGVPPFGGFFSKLLIYNALIGAGQVVFALILILSTAISMLGYMRIIVNLILPPRPPELIGKARESIPATTILCVLAAIIIIIGIYCLTGGINTLQSIIEPSTTLKGLVQYIDSTFSTYMLPK